MFRFRSFGSVAIALTAAVSPCVFAQTLTVSDLVVGQPATLQVVGVAPGASIAWLVAFGGLGAGPCLSVSTCLDVLPPYVLLVITPADAGGGATLGGFVPATTPLVPIAFQCIASSPQVPLFETNAVSTTFLPISHYDDEFEGDSLAPGWSVLHPELATIQVSGGRLDLTPSVGALPNMWYEGGEGVLVRRLVHGDFTVSTRLTVDDPANPGAPPPPLYRFAGISARDPSSTPADEDYVHAALGVGAPNQPIVSEDKSTLDSVSDWLVYPIASNTGELRITRSGSLFSIYYRLDATSSWQLMRAHDRPDLPPVLEVGMMGYAASSPAAVRGRFEWVRFE